MRGPGPTAFFNKLGMFMGRHKLNHRGGLNPIIFYKLGMFMGCHRRNQGEGPGPTPYYNKLGMFMGCHKLIHGPGGPAPCCFQ